MENVNHWKKIFIIQIYDKELENKKNSSNLIRRERKINKYTKANNSESTEPLSIGAINAKTFSSHQKSWP